MKTACTLVQIYAVNFGMIIAVAENLDTSVRSKEVRALPTFFLLLLNSPIQLIPTTNTPMVFKLV